MRSRLALPLRPMRRHPAPPPCSQPRRRRKARRLRTCCSRPLQNKRRPQPSCQPRRSCLPRPSNLRRRTPRSRLCRHSLPGRRRRQPIRNWPSRRRWPPRRRQRRRSRHVQQRSPPLSLQRHLQSRLAPQSPSPAPQSARTAVALAPSTSAAKKAPVATAPSVAADPSTIEDAPVLPATAPPVPAGDGPTASPSSAKNAASGAARACDAGGTGSRNHGAGRQRSEAQSRAGSRCGKPVRARHLRPCRKRRLRSCRKRRLRSCRKRRLPQTRRLSPSPSTSALAQSAVPQPLAANATAGQVTPPSKAPVTRIVELSSSPLPKAIAVQTGSQATIASQALQPQTAAPGAAAGAAPVKPAARRNGTAVPSEPVQDAGPAQALQTAPIAASPFFLSTPSVAGCGRHCHRCAGQRTKPGLCRSGGSTAGYPHCPAKRAGSKATAGRTRNKNPAQGRQRGPGGQWCRGHRSHHSIAGPHRCRGGSSPSGCCVCAECAACRG